MNKVILSGNLSKDIDFATTNNGIDYARTSIAVRRKYKNESGEYDADFFNIVAWRNTAKYLHDYAKKGSKILVSGALQTRTYDAQDGSKRYVTEIVVDEAELIDNKPNSQQSTQKEEHKGNLAPINDDDLPF